MLHTICLTCDAEKRTADSDEATDFVFEHVAIGHRVLRTPLESECSARVHSGSRSNAAPPPQSDPELN